MEEDSYSDKKLYRIRWTHKDTAQAGMGSRTFTFDQATKLCQELNKEYPKFKHSLVETEQWLK